MPSKLPTQKLCEVCHRPIAPARLKALPETTLCIDCARLYPPPPIDPASLDISQSSPINSNGFAPKD